MTNLISKQKGTFSVEFAIIGVIFGVLLVFSADVVVKLTIKGKLDRMSYSAVNVLKERTQFFDNTTKITRPQARALESIIVNSLTRTMGNFTSANLTMVIEELRFPSVAHSGLHQAYQLPTSSSVHCQPSTTMMSLRDLSVETTWGRRTPLYRVTLCYQSNNWFGNLINTRFDLVSSHAIAIGR